MAISRANGDDISQVDAPLLDNNMVSTSVNFKGLPSVRSKSSCWISASFIIGVHVAESFTYFGIGSNLMSYLTGPLGQTTATAAANVNMWSGTSSLLPLGGAFLADSFLGRYRMVIFSNLLYISGLAVLALSAALYSYKSSECKDAVNGTTCSPSQLQPTFIFFSLYLVALAQGGHKPCLQAFGADQFDEKDQEESKAKNSFFNWWNFFMATGILVSRVVVSYIQESLSWELGYGILCVLMCFALLIFLIGNRTYRFLINTDRRNPFVKVTRVLLEAARYSMASPFAISIEKNAQPLQHKDAQLRMRDIEDAKAIVRLVPIWCTCLVYATVFSQVTTLFTKQGATMDRHIIPSFQMPAVWLLSFINLSTIAIVPIYDRILVPNARSISKNPSGLSMLQRIGVGIFLSIFSMVIAALVEMKRLETAAKYGLVDMPKATVPMSIWWLVPQYLVLGITDVFTMVGLQEFFCDQVPIEFRSIGPALYFSVLGMGSFLSSFLISGIDKAMSGHGRDSWFSNNLNRAHLDYFYWLLAGLSTFSFAAYVYYAKSYVDNRRITA